jgi:hypothetical protein
MCHSTILVKDTALLSPVATNDGFLLPAALENTDYGSLLIL